MRQPRHKRTRAQQAASKKWAAAGRASQARIRSAEKAKGLPTRTQRQQAQSRKWAAAGRSAQARARKGLPAVPRKAPALAGGQDHGTVLSLIGAANRDWPCCTATAVAAHLYVTTGAVATREQILALHDEAGGDGGAHIRDVLEVCSSGFAGTRVMRFWPVGDWDLPGTVAGLRLPGGTHAALILSGVACVSWGRVLPVYGEVTEAWWCQWQDARE